MRAGRRFRQPGARNFYKWTLPSPRSVSRSARLAVRYTCITTSAIFGIILTCDAQKNYLHFRPPSATCRITQPFDYISLILPLPHLLLTSHMKAPSLKFILICALMTRKRILARLVGKSAAVSSASCAVVNGGEERSCSGLMDMPP